MNGMANTGVSMGKEIIEELEAVIIITSYGLKS